MRACLLPMILNLGSIRTLIGLNFITLLINNAGGKSYTPESDSDTPDQIFSEDV